MASAVKGCQYASGWHGFRDEHGAEDEIDGQKWQMWERWAEGGQSVIGISHHGSLRFVFRLPR